MTTTSFPVIQIEKTGKRLRNMRKENGIRVAAVCEYHTRGTVSGYACTAA